MIPRNREEERVKEGREDEKEKRKQVKGEGERDKGVILGNGGKK